MSKLDELIAELCPDGVEYRRRGEVQLYRRRGSRMDGYAVRKAR